MGFDFSDLPLGNMAWVILGHRRETPKLGRSGGGSSGRPVQWEGLAFIEKQTQGVAAVHIIPRRRGGLAKMVLKAVASCVYRAVPQTEF